MQRRFLIQFFVQITLLIVLFFVSLLTLAAGLGYYISDSASFHNVHDADPIFFETTIKQHGDDWQLDDKLKKTIDKQQGWLTLYNTDGKLLYQYNVPAGQNVDYISTLQQIEHAHVTVKEIEPISAKPYIVAYGTWDEATQTLNDVRARIDWTIDTLPQLETDAIIYYVAANGDVLQSINPIAKTLTAKTITKLHDDQQFNTVAFTDEATNKTLIVAHKKEIWDDLAFFADFKTPFFIGVAFFFLLLLLGTLFYAKKFGAPLLIIMNWVRRLGQKDYTLPTNKDGKQLLVNKKGNIKRKYKLYKELFLTLENVTATLQQNEEQQQRIEKTREEWISSLSHDLKTPLSSIIGYVKMLQSNHDWSKDEQQQFYAVMDEKSDYMMALIEDLTLTYRLKNGQLPLYKSDVDVNEVIRRTIIQFINNEQYNDYQFDFNSTEDNLVVALDMKWLQRILDNLMMNAIKHNAAGTTIAVTTRREQDNVVILIEDNGSGMDAETVEQLFNRYYRGTNTTEALEGTGLGMAITQQLILLQGGTIDVKSEVGRGTTITIVFPATNEIA